MENVADGFRLRGCLRAAAAIEAEAARLLDGLTESQFHAPPRSGGWSVSYCLEHLLLIGEAFLPAWDSALRQAPRSGLRCEETPAYHWWHRAVLRYAEQPVFKLHSPARYVPYARRSLREAADRFAAMQTGIGHRLVVSRTVDLRQTRVQSPTVPWLSYPLGFSFDLIFSHERRHLRQAWRVRRQLGL